MDYKEEYQKALERAKKGLPIDEVFPELKASEDERIIDDAIQIIRASRQRCAEYGAEADKHLKAISYLEKQKEKPKTADSIPSDCTSDVKCENRWHKVGDSLPDNGRLVLAKDCLGNVLLARFDGENWEVSVYDNEDYYCRNTITKWCEIPSEKQKEQKPVISVEAIREGVAHFGITQYQIDYWLKKHINVVEQEPAEWSEEDEKMLNRVFDAYDALRSYIEDNETSLEENKNYQIKILEGDISWIKNRLKSLHPKHHWKPSEEQMKCLKDFVSKVRDIYNAYNVYTNRYDAYPTLKSLYNDLKKLI